MDKAIIAGGTPIGVDLEKGKTYFFCTCGRSSNQPFCDGGHKGTSFTPLQFKVEEKAKKFLCTCKCSSNQPFCDGSHNQLNKDQIGS